MSTYLAHIFKRRQVGPREEVKLKVFDAEGEPIELGAAPDLPDPPVWGSWTYSGSPLLDDGHEEEQINLTGWDIAAIQTFGDISINEDSGIVTPTPGVFRVSGQLIVGADILEYEILEVLARIDGFPAQQRVRLGKHTVVQTDVEISGAEISFNGVVAIDEDHQGAITLSLIKGVAWSGPSWIEIVNLTVEQIVGDGSYEN